MKMVRYTCPKDGKLAFKAEGPLGVRVEWFCRACRSIVNVVAAEGGPIVRTYVCTRCSREQTCVDPVDDRSHCIPCGTPTLQIIAEHRPESATSAEPKPMWSSR